MPETSTETEQSRDVEWVELRGRTRTEWLKLKRGKQNSLLSRVKFIKRWHGHQLFLDSPRSEDFVVERLSPALEALVGSTEFVCLSSAALIKRRSTERLEEKIRSPEGFVAIQLGANVAERDSALLDYFVATKTYRKVASGEASVIIGPKGSGKTAILRVLQMQRPAHNAIVITPENFATSMLKQVVDDGRGIWDEDQAFVSTWIFTILVEVFKRLSVEPRGVPTPTLKKLRHFLRDNANFQELDLFTRFIGYLKRIEGVKVGNYELTLKTKMLQDLYSLAPLYEIVPGLRGAGGDIWILLDELDTGWDNSSHANLFIASLLQAAIKIQGLGLKARVVTFLRSEIFDLITDKLDHLDKLRSGIQLIRWSPGELADLVARRVAHSLSLDAKQTKYEIDVVSAMFEGRCDGLSGFDFVLSRTSLRPREVLQCMGHAHALAVESGLNAITPAVLRVAEEDFSRWKLEHLCSEYRHIFPGLRELLWGFRGMGLVLSLEDALGIVERFIRQADSNVPAWAMAMPRDVLQTLYSVDFLGVPRPAPARERVGVAGQYEFAYERPNASVRNAASFLVHPALWSVLELEQRVS